MDLRETVVRIKIALDRSGFRAAKQAGEVLEKGYRSAEAASDKLKTSVDRASKSAAAWALKARAAAKVVNDLRDEIRDLAAAEKRLSINRSELLAKHRTLKSQLKDLNQQRQKSGRDTKELRDHERKLRIEIDKVGREMEDGAKASRQLARARLDLSQKTAQYVRDQRDIVSAAREARRAEAASQRQARESIRIQKRLAKEKARAARNSVGGRVRRAAGRAATNGIQRAGEIGRTAIAGAALGATAIVGNEITKATKAAVEFEKSFADVKKVVVGTDDELNEIAGAAVKLSTEFPIAASGFSDIIAAAGQAGIPKDELVEFAEEAARVGVGFDISAGEAGTALAKLRTSLNLSTPEAVSLSGSINNLSNSLAATPVQVLDVVKRVGALGKVAGGSGQEIAALGASMVAAGSSSEEAATGSQNLFLALSAGEAATDKQRSAFKRLGLDSEDVAESMQKDFGGTIVDVLKRLETMTSESERAGVAMDLIGKKSLGTVGPLIGNADLLAKSLGIAADETAGLASLQKEFETRSSTAANAMKLLQNQINAVRIEVGNHVVPVIKEATEQFGSLIGGAGKLGDVLGEQVAEGLRTLLDRFMELIGPPEQLGGKISKLVNAAFTLVEAFLAIVQGGADLIEFLGTTESAIIAMSVAVGASLGPWGLLGAAIVSAAAIGGNAIGGLISDITGLTARMRELDAQIAKSNARRAELDREEAEIRAGFSDSDAGDVDAQRLRARQQTGFTGELSKTGGESGNTTARQAVINSAIRSAALKIKESGGTVSTDDIIRARQAASAEFARREFAPGLAGAGERQRVNFASEAAKRALADKPDKPAANTKNGKGKRRSVGGAKDDPFAGISKEVRDVIGGSGLSETDGLSRGVLNSVRQSKGLGVVAGGSRDRPTGPNINQTINNNTVNINVDARGRDSSTKAAATRAADKMAQTGVTLTGVIAAKLAAQNVSGRR